MTAGGEGKKSLIASGVLSFFFVPLGWLYAGSFKEAGVVALVYFRRSASYTPGSTTRRASGRRFCRRRPSPPSRRYRRVAESGLKLLEHLGGVGVLGVERQ